MDEYEAVVDRFEGKLAVLILSSSQETLNVPRSKLPRGTHEGHYLKITLKDGEVIEAIIDKEATQQAKERIQEKLRLLRRGDHLESS